MLKEIFEVIFGGIMFIIFWGIVIGCCWICIKAKFDQNSGPKVTYNDIRDLKQMNEQLQKRILEMEQSQARHTTIVKQLRKDFQQLSFFHEQNSHQVEDILKRIQKVEQKMAPKSVTQSKTEYLSQPQSQKNSSSKESIPYITEYC